MIRMQSDEQIKTIVTAGLKAPRLGDEADRRILALIDEKTTTAPARRRPFAVFRYNPGLTAFASAAAVLVVVLIGFLLLYQGPTVHYPFITLAGSHARLLPSGRALEAGSALAEGDIVAAGPEEQSTFLRRDDVAMQLFPRSQLNIASYAPSRPVMTMALERGALYLSKDRRFAAGEGFAVRVRDYLFSLKGTRFYVQVDAGDVITAVCFHGRVDVERLTGGRQSDLLTLLENQKVVIRPDALESIPVTELSEAEKEFGRALDMLIATKKYFTAPPFPEGNGIETPPAPDKETALSRPETGITMTKLGIVSSTRVPGGRVNFFATAPDGKRAYIVNDHELFTLDADVLKPITLSDKNLNFKIGPTVAGSAIVLISTENLYVLERTTGSLKKVIPIKDVGFVSDGYAPVGRGSIVYIPFQNGGYYRFDPGDPAFTLKKIAAEQFPLGPVVSGEDICIGSYYRHYLALVSPEGAQKWKHPFTGTLYSNPVKAGDGFYYCSREKETVKLRRLNEQGVTAEEWVLPAPLVSDFAIRKNKLIGVTAAGELLVYDLGARRVIAAFPAFRKKLTDGELRTIKPLVKGGLVFLGTDDGSLVRFDLEKNAFKAKTAIDRAQSFYEPPFELAGNLYLIANDGRLYKVSNYGE
ncbi:MAG: PQQ-binding-like beta-propeller repeat protein [Spirochaetales bacterium]|nr:PQQ-binding-like beta-propeller repeat protein [Spirochaetales bacterium]